VHELREKLAPAPTASLEQLPERPEGRRDDGDYGVKDVLNDPHEPVSTPVWRVLTRVRVHVLERSQRLPGPPDEVFNFFADAHNLEAITPPFLGFEVVTPKPLDMHEGALIAYRLKLHGLRLNWLTRIDAWEPGVRFVDRQVKGPYRLWHHTHTFEPDGGDTLMRDVVRYALPLGPLGEMARLALVTRDLDRIFDFRQSEIARRFNK
jgi:ligand-binding SRPBCC domain-containing protein